MINMSALCLQLAVFLCFHWTLLKHAGASDVQWKKPGDDITIQCKASSVQQSLALKKGLKLESQVLYAMKSKYTPSKDFRDRLEVNGEFPNLDIVLRNLTPSDTAPYWCEYKAFINAFQKYDISKMDSSVLLIVQAGNTHTTDAAQGCETSQQDLVLVSVAISASVLILIVMVFFIWIIHKKRSQRTSGNPRRVATNDVYEDMRGTIRRGGRAA